MLKIRNSFVMRAMQPIRSFILSTSLFLAAISAALAQPASLAERVTALEARSNSAQVSAELLNQVNQLRKDLTDLRGTVEQLQNENAQLKQLLRDQYLDLDGRLSRLGQGSSGASVSATIPPASSVQSGNVPAPLAPAAPASLAVPSARTSASVAATLANERTAYDVAFGVLKKGDYVDAANLFTSFIELYPNGTYAPNALYWAGESYYAIQNYQMAAGQFRTLIARYPTHDKASGALLKLGLSDYGMGKFGDAESTLKSVIKQYPDSDVANIAKDRLNAIQGGEMH